MSVRSPTSGRPGLNRSPARNIPLRKPAGRNLMVPTNGRGSPRVPRAPRPKKRFFRKHKIPKAPRKVPGKLPGVVQKSVPQAAKAAARSGLGKRLLGLAGRALSVYGALSLISDVFELASPFVHAWLKGGWRGSEASEYEGVSGQPDFEGGQCVANYTVFYDSYIPTFNDSGSGSRAGRPGPVGPASVRQNDPQYPGSWSGGWWENGGQDWFRIWAFPGNYEKPSLTISSVTREDGQADNCGSIPGATTPNPIYDNPTLQNPPELRSPPAIAPQSTPLVQPSPLASPSGPSVFSPSVPTVAPGSNQLPPAVLEPGYQASPNTVPSPSASGESSTPVLPDYSFDTARPTKPGSDSCKQAGDTPCQSSTFEFLEFLDDKLDRMEPEEKECPEPPELLQIDFPYVSCTEEGPEVRSGVFRYDPLSFPGLEALLQEQANLALQGCDRSVPVLAVPDSYNAKVRMNPPKLVLVFRRGNTSAYHSYTVPHPANTQPLEEPPIGEFTKGNILGDARLSDNSHVRANCSSPDEAARVITELLSLVDSSFKDEGTFLRISERRGQVISFDVMKPVAAIFYADGNRTLMPTWRRSFTRSL